MPFLTEVHFQNYRSFLDAKCRLSPVTVVIGANNAGKSNFLRGVDNVVRGEHYNHVDRDVVDSYHRGGQEDVIRCITAYQGGRSAALGFAPTEPLSHSGKFIKEVDERFVSRRVGRYELDAELIGNAEEDEKEPSVAYNGKGVTRVLKMLQLKNREAFSALEKEFISFVPEVRELNFGYLDPGKWFVQVSETGLKEPLPISQLSSGTRTVLALLTIIHQPNHPELILIEDIEHAIHPRGLKPLVETMRKISKEHGVQIIFTTQSPYVLDAFQDPEHWDSVVIVEKRDGVSTLTNAKERLIALGYEREMDKVTLGDLWYSGIMGGVAEVPEIWQSGKKHPSLQ